MKHFFTGFIAILAVLGYESANAECGSCSGCTSCSSCSSCGGRTQTIRITSGSGTGGRVVSTPQVVSNTVNSNGNGNVPVVRVTTGGGTARYVGGTPMVDVDVRAPKDYVVRDAGGNRRVYRDGDAGYVDDDYRDEDYEDYEVRGGVMPVYQGGRQNYRAVAPNYQRPDYENQRSDSRQPTTYRRSNYQPNYQQQDRYYDNEMTPVPDDVYYDDPRYSETAYTQTETRTTDSRSYNWRSAWYVGGRLALNLLSWTNKYKATPPESVVNPNADHDDYSLKPVVGGNIFAGYRFNPNWRADLEFGFTSEYSDSDSGITFKLSVPYVTANVYYDFVNGLYLGAGLGAAFPTIQMEWENFVANSSRKTGASFAGAAMVGYSYNLSKSLILDLRYRLAGYNGTTMERNVTGYSYAGIELKSLETKVGFILDNSISVGLRYEF